MNTITKDLVSEYGTSILSSNNPYPKGTLSLRECQILLNKYGVEKATLIAKRHASLRKVGAN
jgi:hypothetical protein